MFDAPVIQLVPDEVKNNAIHLTFVPDTEIEQVIQEVYSMYIEDYANRWIGSPNRLKKLKVVQKYLVQFFLTLNVRRAESESIPSLSKSISVPKDMGLDQNEYGQMAKRFGKLLGLEWAEDEELQRAEIRIY